MKVGDLETLYDAFGFSPLPDEYPIWVRVLWFVFGRRPR